MISAKLKSDFFAFSYNEVTLSHLLYAMKYLLILGTLFYGSLLYAQSGIKWDLYTSYDGGFKMEVPGAVVEKVDSVETKLGTIVQHAVFHQADAEAPNQVYLVQWYDFPEGGLHADSTELLTEFFQATVEGAAANVRGEVVYQGENNYGQNPGWLWRISYLDNQASIKSRFIIREQRCYLIQVVSYQKVSLNTEVERFLGEFQLL